MGSQSLAFITDTHLDESFLSEMGVTTRDNWSRILESVTENNLQNIVFGGDVGEASAHDWFFDTLNEFNFRFILGNHDHYLKVAEYLPTLEHPNNEFFYSQESGGYKYLYLDSSANIISKHQLEWLKDELKSKSRIVIFIHHPVLPVETFVDTVCPLKNRDELETMLKNSGQKITIFCGHYHIDHTQNKGPITQIITPASSYQLEKSLTKVINTDTFGYRIIRFNKHSIETELVMFD